ncbi:MAG: N-acylglucosamine 2-epimerase [Anaerolineae bacterium]|nr:N-acylglucosamine 2-epimerase [Anaerolineae bacterium]
MAPETRALDVRTAGELRQFYQDHLFNHLLPFWLDKGIDREHGGYFTGFSNSGGKLLHTHKFTWSQGRFVWVWARLACQFSHLPQAPQYLQLARSGAEFLMDHALLPNGHVAFILSREGEPILLDDQGNPRKAGPDEPYDTSTFADCFVVYGLSEYARAAQDRRAFQFALGLYESVEARLARGAFRTDPYPTPEGYRQHGVPMIMLEVTRELAVTCEDFDPGLSVRLHERAGEYARQVMYEHRQAGRDIVIEFLGQDNLVRNNLLGTYINPGHTLESMWFVLHYAEGAENEKMKAEAVQTIRRALELGWDDQYPGLFQFAHMEGGRPRGPVPQGLEDHPMIHKLQEDWDAKLWWVHSEALYALLLAHYYYQPDWAREWFWRVHDYTFATYPAPEGEWMSIRNRDNTPVDKVVALPVKDPFHVPRAFMHIVRLLSMPDWK